MLTHLPRVRLAALARASSTRSSAPARATRSSASRSPPRSSGRSSRWSCSSRRASRCSSLGITAGFGLATGRGAIPMALVRYFLLLATRADASSARSCCRRATAGNVVRLLLLPIPRLGAVHRADGRGARRSVDPADDARSRRRADRRSPSAATRSSRRCRARGGAGAAAAGRRPDVARLDRHSPAAARSPPRRHRHAVRRARPADDRDPAGDAWSATERSHARDRRHARRARRRCRRR